MGAEDKESRNDKRVRLLMNRDLEHIFRGPGLWLIAIGGIIMLYLASK